MRLYQPLIACVMAGLLITSCKPAPQGALQVSESQSKQIVQMSGPQLLALYKCTWDRVIRKKDSASQPNDIAKEALDNCPAEKKALKAAARANYITLNPNKPNLDVVADINADSMTLASEAIIRNRLAKDLTNYRNMVNNGR